ncbi:nascent polypeptide-associated complex subunit alpha, muscle-specific form-like [Oncorhynchus keta]|uniref:nascent polypeptide-associated complex subunit alpha, muscle-specific form-like n=1 Tax=Oncorhynchus keta TaxID=8018 RepID=UPI00227CC20D|nr:nascent polypeptide-associated complex subunit alpha, muscle-specific form-like [Oncorhynchus keta]
MMIQPSKPDVRPSNPQQPTRQPVRPVGLVQPDEQPSRPERRCSNPVGPTRRPVSPVGLVQPDKQPCRPEGRPRNPRNTTRRKVRPSNRVCPVILESQPSSPDSTTTSTVDLVQLESRPTCPAVSLVQPESRPTCPLTLEEPALSESCSFRNNVFVLSMPKAAQPEEAARGSSSPPRDIIRPEAFVQTGPLLARRAQRDAPSPKKVPKPPVAPGPNCCPPWARATCPLSVPTPGMKGPRRRERKESESRGLAWV